MAYFKQLGMSALVLSFVVDDFTSFLADLDLFI